MNLRAPWLWLFALSACTSTCSRTEELAELAARVGSEVERDEGSRQGSWQPAELGATFCVGDGLRTGAHSSAELALLPSGAAQIGPHSLVRFLATAPARPSPAVSVEVGEVEVRAEQIDLVIHTPRTIAQVSRGSKMRLSMREGRERFDLLVGRVVVAYAGVERALVAAQPFELSADSVPDSSQPALAGGNSAPVDAGAPAYDAEAVAPAADAASATLEDAGKRSQASPNAGGALRLSAFETASVHVAEPPIDVFFPGAGCPFPAELRVDGQAHALDGEGATVQLGLGSHRLRMSCGDGLKREARITVKRDAARLELPKRAQSVRVEADGRRYTVRYQNLLPDLTFVWPSEADEGGFTLVMRSGAREITRSASRAEVVLSGALLGEGEHKFWFRGANGRTSLPTTLRLAFDNTARSAYLSLPVEGSAVNEAMLAVEGAALVASKVSVQGKPAKLDEQGRFREQAELAPAQKLVSVRVEHPGSGVHYFVRRLR